MLSSFKSQILVFLACVVLVSADQLSDELSKAAGLGAGVIENSIEEFFPNGTCHGDHGARANDCDDLRLNLDKKDLLVKNADGNQFLCSKDCCITAVLTAGSEKTMTQGDLAKWGYAATRKCNGPNLQSFRSAIEKQWPAPYGSGAQYTMCMSSYETMKECKK